MSSPGFNLVAVELIVTTACPLGCPYCYVLSQPDYREIVVPLETIDRRLERLTERGLVSGTRLTLIGGEPLTHPDIRAIVERTIAAARAVSSPAEVCIATSGAFPDANAVDIESTARWEEVQWHLSLQGRRNAEAYSEFLALLCAPDVARRVIRTNVVVTSRPDALEKLSMLLQAVQRSPRFAETLDRRAADDVRAKLDRFLGDENKHRQGFEIRDPDGWRLIFGFTKALNVGGSSLCFRVTEPEFRCPIVAYPQHLSIAVDEDGMVRPCVTPRQRTAAVVFEDRLEELASAPSKDELYDAVAATRLRLIQAIMAEVGDGDIDPQEALAALVRDPSICNFCGTGMH